jgi:hypothetical protein
MIRRLYHRHPASAAGAVLPAIVPLVPLERPVEHLRNALQIARVFLDMGELIEGRDGPCVAVSIEALAAVQARIEAALDGWARGETP